MGEALGSEMTGGTARSVVDRRPRYGRALVLALTFGLGLAGCTREPELAGALPTPETAGAAPLPVLSDLPTPDTFHAPRARFHLDALNDLTPRTPGSENDRAAREYLERRFRDVGAGIRDVSDRGAPEALQHAASPPQDEYERAFSANWPAPRHLIAEIPGDSTDVVLLVTAYPVVGEDAWIGDSGSALLLELARLIALEKPAYTVQFALAETRADASPPDSEPISAHRARAAVAEAGESLARALAAADGLARIRAVIVFDGVARPELRIARHQRTHPVYRDTFWASARDLGFGTIFAGDAGWASARSLHLGFRARGMDRVLALVDEARARAELTPIRHDAAISLETLEGLGRVTREGIDRIFHRLGRIDAFRTIGSQPSTSGQASPRIPEMPPSS